MKVFVSWSGDLSRKIAELLKKWIPCMIQSVEVFFSPEDIEKGDNWDRAISTQLSECKYGIICLTSENTNAPWVNFEAGAIAKTLDSKVAALMIDIKPSDLRGPLSRYQATKFEKGDFYQLILAINNTLEVSLEDKILENAFDAMWPALEIEINHILNQFAQKNTKQKKGMNLEQPENAPIEEILQLLRKQNSVLSSPENLLPIDYMERIQSQIFERRQALYVEDDMLLEEVVEYFREVLSRIQRCSGDVRRDVIDVLNFEEILSHLKRYARGKNRKRIVFQLRDLERKLQEYVMFRRLTTVEIGQSSMKNADQ